MKCYVIKWITSFILLSLTVLICLKNGEIVIFVFWNVRLKLQYFKWSLCDFYENWHVLPGNLVSTYSSVFLNLKVQLLRKYKNKSVGVRKVVRYSFYSFVGCLYVSGSGSVTSVGEGRANLSAIVYL